MTTEPADLHSSRTGSEPTYGELLPPVRSAASSRVEAKALAMLEAEGIRLLPGQWRIQIHGGVLTPDAVVAGDKRVCIEIDPVGDGDYSSHHVEDVRDEERNRLLADVGWEVIRLRLGAGQSGGIGGRDVVTDTSSLTQAAVGALATAVRDALTDATPRTRYVPRRGAKKARTTPDFQLRASSTRNTEEAWNFSWGPSARGRARERVDLALYENRFLCRRGFGHTTAFVADLGPLHLMSFKIEKRRKILKEWLDGHTLEAVSDYPWGETIALDAAGSSIRESWFRGTTFTPWEHGSVDLWLHADQELLEGSANARVQDGKLLSGEDGSALVELHPFVVDRGWGIANFELREPWGNQLLKLELQRDRTPSAIALEIPEGAEELAGTAGAIWDTDLRCWVLPAGSTAQQVEGVLAWVPKPPTEVYFFVPFDEREDAKAMGGLWDPRKKLWYAMSDKPGSVESMKQRWPLSSENPQNVLLKVPKEDREKAWQVGVRAGTYTYSFDGVIPDEHVQWLPAEGEVAEPTCEE